jgi:iron complex transport system permease protein
VTVALLATGLAGARDAARSADVVWTVPGIGLLVLAVLSAGVTALAWRWRTRRAAR